MQSTKTLVTKLKTQCNYNCWKIKKKKKKFRCESDKLCVVFGSWNYSILLKGNKDLSKFIYTSFLQNWKLYVIRLIYRLTEINIKVATWIIKYTLAHLWKRKQNNSQNNMRRIALHCSKSYHIAIKWKLINWRKNKHINQWSWRLS